MGKRIGNRTELPGKLSISRPSWGDGRETISITIEDKVSGIEFAKVHVGYSEFACALTGQSQMSCMVEVCGLENVGKRYVSEPRSRSVPKNIFSHDRKAVSNWLVENCQEEGWTLNAYLGSQSSLVNDGKGNITVNYSVFKFEEMDNGSEVSN